MNTKIADLMVEKVMTATRHQTIGHVREVMATHAVSCMPVVNPDGEPLGIVTSTDLLNCGHAEAAPVSGVMSKGAYSVPQYADPSMAARIMRNHHVHHVLVTHEGELVGIVSAFDLLRLVEDHRFVMKNAPSTSTKHGGKRRKEEFAGDD